MGTLPIVSRFPVTEMVVLKSKYALQRLEPGVYAASRPALVIPISHVPAGVPTGRAPTCRCQHPTIAVGTAVARVADAEPSVAGTIAPRPRTQATTTSEPMRRYLPTIVPSSTQSERIAFSRPPLEAVHRPSRCIVR